MSKMPFREKLKKAFKTGSPSSSKNPSPTIVQHETRWPSNVYRPDEPMPRPKYRAPVKKEHKERLEAFNFGSSWRRRSHVSLYSPMGSRLPSRRGSRSANNRDSLEVRRKSIAQQSGKTGSTSRSNSITSSFDAKPRPTQRAAQPTMLQPEPEQYGDDDVANVGLSRVNSREKPPRISFSPADPPPGTQATDGSDSAGVPQGRDGDRPHGLTGLTGPNGHRGQGHHEYGSSAAVQETSEPKKDSGPPSEHLVGFITTPDGHKMFSEDELVRAMERNRMSGGLVS